MTEHPKVRDYDRQQQLEKLKQAEEKIKEKEIRKADWRIQKDIEETDQELGVNIPTTTLQDVYNVTERYLHVNDRHRIDLILATALSNQLPGTPIWMFIVGNSGDWKSAFTRSLEGLNNCRKVDMITKNTLATGAKDAWDLGSELDNNSTILLFPDLASLTSMNTDDKNVIWSQFRNLYDGLILKDTGGDVRKAYENCHVTIIACTTPAIRDEILIHAQLGTRELMYDTQADRVDNTKKMKMAWENEKCEEEMRQEIQNVVCNFLKTHIIAEMTITDEIQKYLMKEAEKLSILRASGSVDRRYKELINPLYPEVPTRLIKQLKRIYISLKSLDKTYSDVRAKKVISHIVNSSGNKVRQIILDFIIKDNNEWYKISDVQQQTKLGRSTIKTQLEMLWNLGVVSKKVIEEIIGGNVYTDRDGVEHRRGRIEEVAYYCYRSDSVNTHSTTTHKTQNSTIEEGECVSPLSEEID